MFTTRKPAGGTRKRRWRRVAAGVAALSLLGLVAIWLAFQYRPRWYRPPMLDDEGLRRARVDAVNTADRISDGLAENRPFELTLTDTTVNEWLAAWPTSHPESYQAVPPEIRGVAVRFEPGLFRVGAHFEKHGWESILNIAIQPKVESGEQAISLSLLAVRAGSLPFPGSALERILVEIQAVYGQDGGTTSDILEQIHGVDDLYKGIRIDNRFTWFNGKRPFVVEAIILEDGVARLRLRPERPSRARNPRGG